MMKFMNQARTYGAKLAVAGAALTVPVLAFATGDESGITTTEAVAVIGDGKEKGIVIGLAMLGLVVVFGILRRVRGVAK